MGLEYCGVTFPVEVLELVLANLPLKELLTSCSLVCRQWHSLINRPGFLQHRKFYWRYRLDEERAVEDIAQLLRERNGGGGPLGEQLALSDALPWILTMYSKQPEGDSGARSTYCFPSKALLNLKPGEVLFPLIPKHPRYKMATALLYERFPSLTSLPTTSAIALVLIVVTARDVGEVKLALDLCLAPSSVGTSVLVVDLFYHLATLLLALQQILRLPPRHHYILQYALALHHASWNLDPTDTFKPRNAGKRADASKVLPLTSEQRAIVNMNVRGMIGGKDTVRIMAYAGTGKTTTLVELTKRNPNTRFLLVVFNKSVQLHSESVFPSNVTVRTANALSYKYIEKTETSKRFVGWGVKYTDLLEHNLVPHRNTGKGTVWEGFNIFQRAAMIIETLHAYYLSIEENVQLEHAPKEWPVKKQRELRPVPEGARGQLVEDATEVWRKILKGRHVAAKFDHNSSMKKFQLAKPDIAQFVKNSGDYEYEVLLMDEAQDMNPAMLDICLNQDKPKIVVGDPHQQIYSFNGAVNALSLVEEHSKTQVSRTYYLTQSFRFGPEIAFMAECCLSGLVRKAGVKAPPLNGGGKADFVVGDEEITKKTTIAVISRTNMGQFEEMVKVVCEKPRYARPKIALPFSPGAEDPFGWGLLLDLAYYCIGQRKNMSLKAQRNKRYDVSWKEFTDRAASANDKELISKITIVEKYKDLLPGYIKILEEQAQYGIDDPRVDYIFSTVHKFKGLECDSVRLLSDFCYNDIPFALPTEASKAALGADEYNLLYVGLTRAKKNLIINDALFFLLTSSFMSYSFENLELTSECSEASCVKCGAVTNNMLEEDSPCVSVVQHKVRVAASKFRKGGTLCALCACSPRVNLYKLGGQVQREVHIHQVGFAGNAEDWQVAPGMLEDPGHTFLSPLLLPPGMSPTAAELAQHRNWMATRVRESRELENITVTEVVVEEVEEEVMIPEDDDDAWMLDLSDDAVLLAAANDSNENLVPAEEPSEKKPKLHHSPTSSPAKCYKCGQPGHFSSSCSSTSKPKRNYGSSTQPRKSKFCYRCKQEGHWASKCPCYPGAQEQNPTCYQCGEPGHRRSWCPQRLQGVTKNSKQEWHEPEFD